MPDVAAELGPGEAARQPGKGPAGRGRIGAGLALSLLLHGAIAALVLLGPEAARVLPPVTDEPIEVVLIAPPPPARDEEAAEEEGAQAEPPPPPAPEEEPAEEPAAEDAEQEEQPAAETPPEPQEPPLPQSETAAAPRVLIPVTEFAEEDSGGTERDGEIAARESTDPPSEPAPDAGGEAQADEAPAGTDTEAGTETGEQAGEQAGEGAPQEEAAAPEMETADETVDQPAEQPEPETETETETEVAALTDPGRTETETATDVEVPETLAAPGDEIGDEIGDVIGEGIGLPRAKPEEIARLAEAPADPRARAEAVARAIAATTPGSGGLDFARPGRGAGGGLSGDLAGDLAGGTTATRLFSREISDDPRMRTAMNGMPHSARVDLLCMTELRAQLRVATPPYHADLLPSFRLESGTVLEPRRAAFRAGGQWYDLAFRCELNTQVTRVERFTFRVGAPVPRADWSARGFPRN